MPMWARSLTFSHGYTNYTNLSQPHAWLWSPTTVLISAHDKAPSEVVIVLLTNYFAQIDGPVVFCWNLGNMRACAM